MGLAIGSILPEGQESAKFNGNLTPCSSFDCGAFRLALLQTSERELLLSVMNKAGFEKLILILEPRAELRQFEPLGALLEDSTKQGEDIAKLLHRVESYAIDSKILVTPIYPQNSASLTPTKPPKSYDLDVATYPYLVKQDGNTSLKVSDPLTGLPNAICLRSEEEATRLNETFGRLKAVFFIDISHMRVANTYGFEKQVNQLLKEINRIAQQAFGNSAYQLYRLGGDELCLICDHENRHFIGSKMEAFERAYCALRDETLIAADKSMFKQAREYAYIRSMLRRCRKAYLKECEQKEKRFSIAEYEQALMQKLNTTWTPEEHISSAKQAVTHLDSLLDEARPVSIEASSEQLLGLRISAAVVIEGNLNVNLIAQAISKAQDLLSKGRLHQAEPHSLEAAESTIGEGTESSDSEISLDRFYSDKLEELHRLKANERLNGKTSRVLLEYALRSLRGLMAKDPALGEEVLRYPSIATKPLSEYLLFSGLVNLNVLRIDIQHFGAINNNLGYAQADSIYKYLANIAKQQFGPCLALRASGGALLLLRLGSIKDIAPLNFQEMLEQRFQTALHYLIDTPAFDAEVEESLALEEWRRRRLGKDSSEFLPHKRYRAANISFHSLNVTPSMSFKDALREIL